MPVFEHVLLVTGLPTRRALLQSGVLALPLLAGCSLPGDPDEIPTPESYPHIERTSVFRDSRVDIDFPSAVPKVSRPAEADVALFPTDPDIDPNRAVEWLIGGTVVGIVGRPAHEFIVRVQRSEAASAELGQGGYGVPDPAPHFQLGYVTDGAGGGIVATSSYSWGSLEDGETPTDEQVLGALETFLTDRASETTTR